MLTAFLWILNELKQFLVSAVTLRNANCEIRCDERVFVLDFKLLYKAFSNSRSVLIVELSENNGY